MTEQDVQIWLDKYGEAWIQGDPDSIIELFATAATYQKTPFDPPMEGREQIRSYWQDDPSNAEDVRFSSQVWAVADRMALAGWQASFTHRNSGARVQLDGTFRLTFASQDGDLQCKELKEWWHRQELQIISSDD